MLSGILSPAFLQAAGRAGKGEPMGKIILDTQFADPIIESISCTGEIKVFSIKNGAPLVETYTDLNGEKLSIQADANTQIVIYGTGITDCSIGENYDYTKISVKNTALVAMNCYGCAVLQELNLSANTALTSMDCYSCTVLQELNLSENTALSILNCSDCYVLQELNLSANTALTSLSCSNCIVLKELNLSANTALASLNCSNCYVFMSISYPATNEGVSTAVAGAITNAESATGTVYTDSEAAYYNTIATAATTKGWTIAQIAA